MGFLLALMVFVYPLALPILTVVVLLFIVKSIKLGLLVALTRGLLALSLLSAFFSPGLVSNGSGSFLLPSWLHIMVGHSNVRYYPLAFLFTTVALALFLSACTLALRALIRASS